ncbi:hypothetical protein Tco_1519291, partial [Tanacetum coccineum]
MIAVESEDGVGDDDRCGAEVGGGYG